MLGAAGLSAAAQGLAGLGDTAAVLALQALEGRTDYIAPRRDCHDDIAAEQARYPARRDIEVDRAATAGSCSTCGPIRGRW